MTSISWRSGLRRRAPGRRIGATLAAVAAFVMLGLTGLGAVELQTESVPWDLQIFALHTAHPPTIDGELSEWDMERGEFRINGKTWRAHGIQDGDWDGDGDASAVCALRWDEENLYAAAIVTDDHPVPATRSVDIWAGNIAADAPWRHDSWMLYFDTIGQPAGTGRYHPKRTWPSLTHPFIGITLATGEGRNIFLPEGCEARTRVTETGYVLECKIAWAALGFDVRAGDRLRLGHILVDDDPGQWGQIGAYFGGPHDARTWGRLRLVDATGVGADIIVGKDAYVLGQPVRVKGSADSMTGAGAISSITFSGPDGFHRVFPAREPLAAGSTTLALLSVSSAGWPTGSYKVSLAAEGAPQAEAQFRLAPRAEAQEPLVQGVTVIPAAKDPRKALPFGLKEGPKPQEVTRHSYLEFIRERSRSAIDSARTSFLQGNDKSISTASEGLFYAAFEYMVDRKPEDARLALDILKKLNDTVEEGAAHLSAWEVRKIHYANKWLSDSPHAEEMLAQTRRAMRNFMPDWSHFGHYGFRERGAMNRSMHVAWAAETVLHYIPDLPEADRWRTYIEAVWNDWFEHCDIAENSTNYDPIDLEVLIDWIPLRPHPEKIWAEPGVRALFERYMLRTLPLGVIPSHGDCCPVNTNWHGWVAPFEVAAAQYKDGRFTWAAHRLFSYALRHCENIWCWDYVGGMGAVRLAAVYDRIDTNLKPVPPAPNVRVMHRQRIEMLPHRERKPNKLNLVLHADRMPDKAVFSSSNEPEALAAFFDLCGEAGHSVSTSPNLCGLVDRGAYLLHDLGYYEKGPEHHNVIYLEDLEGVPAAGEETTRVVEIAEGTPAAYGAFVVSNYKGWPVVKSREVLFVKGRMLMLRDTVRFLRSFRVRLGPAFQLCEIGPAFGDNWVNCYISVPYSRPLADYPLGRWYNPPRDLFIYYFPHEDRRLELVDRKAQKINQLPVRARYYWTGMAGAGEEIAFTTLLIPHEPSVAPQKIASGIEVLRDTTDVAAVRISAGDITEYLILNRTGQELSLDGLRTDAQQAYVRLRGGQVECAWARHGTQVKLRGMQAITAGKTGTIEFSAGPSKP